MKTSMKKSVIALSAIALVALATVPTQAATTTPAPKPSITGVPSGGDDGGHGGHGGFRGGFGGGPNSAAFAKYTACLAKAGIKFPSFGGGGGFGGQRPSGAPATGSTTPRPRPTFSLSPAQQKAFTACASLRPKFSGFGGGQGGQGGGFNRPGGANGGSTTNGSTSGGTATLPKTGTSAAYLKCLNAHGLPLTSSSQIAGLDNQNPKIIAALKACAGK